MSDFNVSLSIFALASSVPPDSAAGNCFALLPLLLLLESEHNDELAGLGSTRPAGLSSLCFLGDNSFSLALESESTTGRPLSVLRAAVFSFLSESHLGFLF